MKKSIAWGAIIIFFAIAIAVAVISYAIGTILSREGVAKRGLFEAYLISESDRVETHVRSFLRATDLSSIQSIYDSGTEYVVLPYDFSAPYSPTYEMAYWQIYDEMRDRMPPPPIMLNKVRQEVSWISSCYLYDYQKAFIDFSQSSDLIIPDPDSDPTITRVTNIDADAISIEGEPTAFSKITRVQDQEINIMRDFTPYSIVDTKFGRIIEIAWDIISDDELGECVRGNTCSYTNEDELQSELKNLETNFEESDIDVIFDLKNYNSGVINVSIYDTSKDYTLYSFPSDIAGIGFLGVNFLVKAGDSGDRSDEVPASSLIYDCDVGSGYSGLGIISSKTTKDDICKYFKVTAEDCDDTDGGLNYVAAGTCTDFIGSYGDMCFDLDNNGEAETLYEYGCHDSNVCYSVYHFCTSGCVDNACVVACTGNADCWDDNVCTQDICNIGATPDENTCDNPPEPSTVSCGTKTRECSSSNCWCEGDDWICETDTDKQCTSYCDGVGGCNLCNPDPCDTVDSGCCADSDCPAETPNCNLDTHTCVACVVDDDCSSDGWYCNGDVREERNWYCENSECKFELKSSENCNDYDDDWYCDGDVRKQWDWSCDDSNSPTSVECYQDSLTDSEDCNLNDGQFCTGGIEHDRDYYCSGEPNADCNSYTSSNEKYCRYGCKPGTNRCYYGYYCSGIYCSVFTDTTCMGSDNCLVSPQCKMEGQDNPYCWIFTTTYYCWWPNNADPCYTSCDWGCCWLPPEKCISPCDTDPSDACTYI